MASLNFNHSEVQLPLLVVIPSYNIPKKSCEIKDKENFNFAFSTLKNLLIKNGEETQHYFFSAQYVKLEFGFGLQPACMLTDVMQKIMHYYIKGTVMND